MQRRKKSSAVLSERELSKIVEDWSEDENSSSESDSSENSESVSSGNTLL